MFSSPPKAQSAGRRAQDRFVFVTSGAAVLCSVRHNRVLHIKSCHLLPADVVFVRSAMARNGGLQPRFGHLGRKRSRALGREGRESRLCLSKSSQQRGGEPCPRTHLSLVMCALCPCIVPEFIPSSFCGWLSGAGLDRHTSAKHEQLVCVGIGRYFQQVCRPGPSGVVPMLYMSPLRRGARG